MLLSDWAIRCTANTLDNVKTPDIAGVAVSAVDCRLSRTNVSVVDDEHVVNMFSPQSTVKHR